MLINSRKYTILKTGNCSFFEHQNELMNESFGLSVVNNIFAGFNFEGNTGNYQPQLYDWYQHCNFMVDLIPFEHAPCAQQEA